MIRWLKWNTWTKLLMVCFDILATCYIFIFRKLYFLQSIFFFESLRMSFGFFTRELHKEYMWWIYSRRFDGNSTFLERPFLAFGDGPRSFIATRLGKMQAKIGVVLMLWKFKFELCDKYKNQELQINPCAYPKSPINGINLKVMSRQ